MRPCRRCSLCEHRSDIRQCREAASCEAMWSKPAWGKGSKQGKGKGSGKAAEPTADAWASQAWNDNSKGGWSTQAAPPSSNWGYDDGSHFGQATGKGWTPSAGPKGQDSAKGKGKEWVPRLEGKYALAKTILRPYADERGHAVYAQNSAQEFFGKHNMRQIIDSRNSELARRPAIGISVVSSSMLALSTCFEEDATEDDKKFEEALEEMKGLISDGDGTAFKAACETLCRDRTNQASPEKLRKAIEIWIGFFRKHKDTLQKVLPQVLSRSSLLYMGGVQALEACTLANALGNWSSKVPTTVTNASALSRWQESPKNLKHLIEYLVEAFGQRHADDAAWKRAHGGWGGDSDDENEGQHPEDDAWGLPASTGRKRKSNSPSSSSSSSKRRRKAAKKAEKKKAKKALKATRAKKNEELAEGEDDEIQAGEKPS